MCGNETLLQPTPDPSPVGSEREQAIPGNSRFSSAVRHASGGLRAARARVSHSSRPQPWLVATCQTCSVSPSEARISTSTPDEPAPACPSPPDHGCRLRSVRRTHERPRRLARRVVSAKTTGPAASARVRPRPSCHLAGVPCTHWRRARCRSSSSPLRPRRQNPLHKLALDEGAAVRRLVETPWSQAQLGGPHARRRSRTPRRTRLPGRTGHRSMAAAQHQSGGELLRVEVERPGERDVIGCRRPRPRDVVAPGDADSGATDPDDASRPVSLPPGTLPKTTHAQQPRRALTDERASGTHGALGTHGADRGPDERDHRNSSARSTS